MTVYNLHNASTGFSKEYYNLNNAIDARARLGGEIEIITVCRGEISITTLDSITHARYSISHTKDGKCRLNLKKQDQ